MNIINALTLTADQLEQLARIKRMEQELLNSISGATTATAPEPPNQAAPVEVKGAVPEKPAPAKNGAAHRTMGLREAFGTHLWAEVNDKHHAITHETLLRRFCPSSERSTVNQEIRIWCIKGLLRWTNEKNAGYGQTLTLTPLGRQYAEMYSKSMTLMNRSGLTPINKLPNVVKYSKFMAGEKS